MPYTASSIVPNRSAIRAVNKPTGFVIVIFKHNYCYIDVQRGRIRFAPDRGAPTSRRALVLCRTGPALRAKVVLKDGRRTTKESVKKGRPVVF